MEAIEVTARFDPSGKILPLSFRWRGSQYQVDAVGRHWQTEDGFHWLVLSTSGQAFELLYVAAEACWYLVQTPSSSQLV